MFCSFSSNTVSSNHSNFLCFLSQIAVAAIIFAGVAALAGVTGGALNIARWLGPAIVSVTFLSDFWVYLASWFIGMSRNYIILR